MNESSNPIQPGDRIHALLCAYLFGEATPEERAEVENALARSSELRAEHARLSATVGLVRGAYQGDEKLSDETLASLVDRAIAGRATPPARRWYASPALRAAAAVLALGGGVLGVLQMQKPSASRDETVADAKSARSDKDRGDLLDSLTSSSDDGTVEGLLSEIGYLGDDEESRSKLELDGASSTATRAGEEAARMQISQTLSKDADAPSAGPASPMPEEKAAAIDEAMREFRAFDTGGVPSEAEELGRLAALGYTADGGGDAGDEATRLGERQNDAAKNPAPSGQPATGGDSLGVYSVTRDLDGFDGLSKELKEELESLGYSTTGMAPVPESSTAAPSAGGGDDEVAPSSSSVAVGGGGSRQVPLFRKRGSGAGIFGPKDTGTYKGSGDSVPSTPGPAGAPPAQAPPPPSNSLDDPAAAFSTPHPQWDEGERLDETVAEVLLGEDRKEAEAWLGQHLIAFGDDDGRDGDELARRIQGWRETLSPEERAKLAERCSEIVISGCRRWPDERPRDMYFRFWGDNGFELAQLDRLSTFAADVDTASYALARTYLERNHLPEKAQVRTEEFVNYFAPDLAPPTEDTFAISTELAPSLFGGSEDRWMLRVGVRAREVSRDERKPLVLVFVVDTSGSMEEGGRLELVKHAMRLLVGELDARDKIGLVGFSTDARLILPVTPANQRGLIESAIHPLRPDGSTNAEAGLRMGYELALGSLDREAVNRVILLSDGVANTGQTDQDRISESVRTHREKGIYLNTVGVGMNNHNDVLLEQLADRGDGICDYVDDADSARRALVERFTGAFEPVASDVKIQVEFDPAQVYRWRQLGYENRAVADADFRNDAVDAGEIGAGHQVVALYEIERATGAASEAPLATVRLRWKAPKAPGQDPREIEVSERESKLAASQALGSFASASYGYRRSVLAAQFAEFLRRSSHTEKDRYSDLLSGVDALAREKPDAESTELAALVVRAADLIRAAHDARFQYRSELDRVLDEYRRREVLRAELECLERTDSFQRDQDILRRLEEMQLENRELEQTLRDLIRRRICDEKG